MAAAAAVMTERQRLASKTSLRPTRLRDACNQCHAAKVKCSRDKSGCTRCKQHSLSCEYSESMAGKVPGKRAKKVHNPPTSGVESTSAAPVRDGGNAKLGLGSKAVAQGASTIHIPQDYNYTLECPNETCSSQDLAFYGCVGQIFPGSPDRLLADSAWTPLTENFDFDSAYEAHIATPSIEELDTQHETISIQEHHHLPHHHQHRRKAGTSVVHIGQSSALLRRPSTTGAEGTQSDAGTPSSTAVPSLTHNTDSLTNECASQTPPDLLETVCIAKAHRDETNLVQACCSTIESLQGYLAAELKTIDLILAVADRTISVLTSHLSAASMGDAAQTAWSPHSQGLLATCISQMVCLISMGCQSEREQILASCDLSRRDSVEAGPSLVFGGLALTTSERQARRVQMAVDQVDGIRTRLTELFTKVTGLSDQLPHPQSAVAKLGLITQELRQLVK